MITAKNIVWGSWFCCKLGDTALGELFQCNVAYRLRVNGKIEDVVRRALIICVHRKCPSKTNGGLSWKLRHNAAYWENSTKFCPYLEIARTVIQPY